MRLVLAVAILAATGSAVSAAESYVIAGTQKGQSASEIMPVGEGMMVMHLVTDYEPLDFGGGTPMDGLPGKCFGTISVSAMGAQGGGVCVWTNGGEDTYALDFKATGMTPERKILGTWTITGGAGMLATIAGGGAFASATNPETGETTLDVTGAATLN